MRLPVLRVPRDRKYLQATPRRMLPLHNNSFFSVVVPGWEGGSCSATSSPVRVATNLSHGYKNMAPTMHHTEPERKPSWILKMSKQCLRLIKQLSCHQVRETRPLQCIIQNQMADHPPSNQVWEIVASLSFTVSIPLGGI
ncbi:hypothetical protein NDU88_004001 [Pleurodeles waltl]|uniref:Uncharacterized protein n=1 Tax=Pleurodeles waltl TaxID=8319 RepID=A0AAV7M726_PLEWA|nr:hypothetical protein NDU88_004001 [Pleurodeles waltl]